MRRFVVPSNVFFVLHPQLNFVYIISLAERAMEGEICRGEQRIDSGGIWMDGCCFCCLGEGADDGMVGDR